MTPSASDLTRSLMDEVRSALVAMGTDELLAWIDHTVKERTARGEFLEGSTLGHQRYHDRAHIRFRQRKGLQVAHVDLRVTGSMLDATKGRATSFADAVRVEYGYLAGLSDVEATRIAEYHQVLGAGQKAHDKRVFIGLTDAEEAELHRLAQDILARYL